MRWLNPLLILTGKGPRNSMFSRDSITRVFSPIVDDKKETDQKLNSLEERTFKSGRLEQLEELGKDFDTVPETKLCLLRNFGNLLHNWKAFNFIFCARVGTLFYRWA